MREKTLKDKANALNSAKQQGRKLGKEEGLREARFEIAKNLLDILDNEMISIKTGLSVDEIENLRK